MNGSGKQKQMHEQRRPRQIQHQTRRRKDCMRVSAPQARRSGGFLRHEQAISCLCYQELFLFERKTVAVIEKNRTSSAARGRAQSFAPGRLWIHRRTEHATVVAPDTTPGAARGVGGGKPMAAAGAGRENRPGRRFRLDKCQFAVRREFAGCTSRSGRFCRRALQRPSQLEPRLDRLGS